jgi:ketosteroid isomerase-like protein
MNMAVSASDEEQIRSLLERWATTTRQARLDEVLDHHAPDVLIYDVLPPMKYEGAAAYRKSWGDWQPTTQAEGHFDWRDLTVVSGSSVAFAHGFIHCAGTLMDGTTFEDLVRATFCLGKSEGRWTVLHQHMSKPFEWKSAG